MVDFNKLIKKKSEIDYTDLLSLFESLDRKTSHTDLRPAQVEALRLLSERRPDRDTILKVSTGAGKTAIGSLWLLSFMGETREPVVYLCPTRQLCQQVSDECEKLGIQSTLYKGGDPFPDVSGTSGKAIIICTYDKLFNAKTTFDRRDVLLRPHAMVLDDAHAGVEEIRDSFTLHISGDNLHKDMLKVLNTPCRDFNSALWRDIIDENPDAAIEVPYWIWQPLQSEVDSILADHANDGSYSFTVSYVRDVLRWCRCVVAGDGIEVVPDVLPVHKSEAFYKAPHRLFMSATLADDSVLVRELACDISAAMKPVVPTKDKGVGERMILAPSLFDPRLDRQWVMDLCRRFAKRVNVVVLTPSE